VVGDRAFDGEAGLLAEPRLEDAADARTIARGQRDAELEGLGQDDPGNGRPTTRRRRDPEVVEIAAEPEGRAVGEATAGGELGSLACPTVKVPADPGLPLPEEGVDPWLGMGPAAARRRRDGDDEAELVIDRDPEMARPRRVTEGVGERRSAQRARPSRSVATAFSIRRWRVSSAFAASIGSTQNRWLL
jgi:hypothetical protein